MSAGSMPASELLALLVLVVMAELRCSLDGFLGVLYNSIHARQVLGIAPNLTLSNYWPPGVPREETLEAFRQAFAALGNEVCDDDRLEEGYEKVALFAYLGAPKHTAGSI